jgi:hypothetical protein
MINTQTDLWILQGEMQVQDSSCGMNGDILSLLDGGCRLQPGVIDLFISELLACRKGLEEAKSQRFISGWTVES